MKKLSFVNIWALVLLLALQLLFADGGKTGLSFLKNDVDGRAAALGGAFTARAVDASAAFWNPAGLADAGSKNFMVMHSQLLADITQQFAAVQLMSGQHNLALSVDMFTIPGVEIRGETPTDEPYGKVDAFNFYGGLSYARALSKTWRAGITVKYLFEKYYLHSASGWVVDLGVRGLNLIENLNVALVIRNLGKMSPLEQVATPLPLMVNGGLEYALPLKLTGQRPVFSADVQMVRNDAFYWRGGLELPVLQYIRLRGGIIAGGNRTQFSGGLGINYLNYHLDYALIPFSDYLGTGHRISFGMQF